MTGMKRKRATDKTKHFAVIGAGIAGIACARTLVQAGHTVTVFEKAILWGSHEHAQLTIWWF